MKVAIVFLLLAFWGAVRTCAVEERAVVRSLQKEGQVIMAEANAARTARRLSRAEQVENFLEETSIFTEVVDQWQDAYLKEKARLQGYTAEVLDDDQRPAVVEAVQSLFPGHNVPADAVETLITTGVSAPYQLDDASYSFLYFKFSAGFFSYSCTQLLEDRSCDTEVLAGIENILTVRTLPADDQLYAAIRNCRGK